MSQVMDAETRLKIIIGQLVMQQAGQAAALEEAQAKIAELEVKVTKDKASPADA